MIVTEHRLMWKLLHYLIYIHVVQPAVCFIICLIHYFYLSVVCFYIPY